MLEPEKTQDQPLSPVPAAMIQAANAALMERPAFAIDDAGDDDLDDLDDDIGGDDDDQVMDEVSNLFLPCLIVQV